MNKKLIAIISSLSLCVGVTAYSRQNESDKLISKSESLINI